MDLNQQAVSAGRDGRFGHRGDQVPFPGRMAGINDDRQVRKRFQGGDCGEIQRIAVMRLEGPNPAFAEHDVLVPTRHDVLRRQQPFLDGRR